MAAILKRLVHRNANVQLYALTLADALSKNCGLVAHRELASRSFCQTLQRIVTDRNTHATVKRKGLVLIKEWCVEWGQDESLGIVRETMDTLKRQGIRFDDEPQDPPPEPSSEQLRAEDEELRRVLELSLQDQGGRDANPTGSVSSGAAGPSGAANGRQAAAASAASSAYGASAPPGGSGASSRANQNLPDPSRESSAQPSQQQQGGPAASRVRALYDFVPTEEGELAFRKGDVIRVLDSVYEHWWRGELHGAAGIFPVNYVEILPDPTPADIQREAELEARIFVQANDIDRLLSKLRGLDPARDNLAEDEELQELYQSSLSMRPKIVKLIDRYNLKVSELRSMNEKFVRARSTYDAMMGEVTQKHSANGAVGPGHPYSARPGALQPDGRIPSNGSGQPGAARPHSAQPPPQQEYAQEWAQWYAQQGYPAQSPQAAHYQQAPPQNPPSHAQDQQPPQQHAQQQQQHAQQQQLPPDAPPYGSPEYAQWYYAQQQQQEAPHQQASGQSAPSGPSGSGSGSGSGGGALPNGPVGGGSGEDDDDEKRRIFERARAEAEAYHRAHQQHQPQQQPQPQPPQQGYHENSNQYQPQYPYQQHQQGTASAGASAPSAPLL